MTRYFHYNRRKFLKQSGQAALAVAAAGVPGAGFWVSCRGRRAAEEKETGLSPGELLERFRHPPEPARPWVFWYWMHASVSGEGITADLEAMKEAGIGGAYLMPIKGKTDPPLLEPPVEQLSPEWWEMVRHAMNEADRLGLQLAMHACDGFAVAGGPWVTPELSMQKVVWTETHIRGGNRYQDVLPQPETNEDYYRDIAVLAFRAPEDAGLSTRTILPRITTSVPGADAGFLVKDNHEETFRSSDPCWIQYAFDRPFTCRSIRIRTNGNNYQSHRLLVEAGDDDRHFRRVKQLEAPRHGWQDTDADVTHAIPPVTARFFRFSYDKAGSEPGSEDLDSAKWKQSLKIRGIELSGTPRLNQFEGKTGAVWRISRRTTAEEVPDELCIAQDRILDLTGQLDAEDRLDWEVPAGNWIILRMGHTSTGHTNYTGGKGLGLECDKFNPEAVKMQFDRWFGEAFRAAGPDLAARVLKIFHVDSWECGSQNWSGSFPDEFRKRRGYDLQPYLPVMAGIPVGSADISERFLHDVRRTIAELVKDRFFGTFRESTHARGCSFSAECVAPTMCSDGMLHYDEVDIPMGEFWLRSPTHDKPNDMLDAISGARVYGKPLVQAEAFTELRLAWDEHPGMLKALGDRNYALGINRFVFHVFTHNPWTDRKPGMTLDRIGLYFQRDQTWWKPGKAWVEYLQRCQAVLQSGHPVTDIAVFTGEETPRRALLPDRLVPTLPGIFGKQVVEKEARRLANEGEPLREMPDGVTHSANMADPEDWIDPLRGYAYDSINRDALLRLATVRNGRIELPGGASYALLVLPGSHRMSPEGDLMTPGVAARLLELVQEGATILVSERPARSPGLENFPGNDTELQDIAGELWKGAKEAGSSAEGGAVTWQSGKGRVIRGPYQAASFGAIGIEPDLIATELPGDGNTGTSAPAKREAHKRAKKIAWTHRREGDLDLYFISNQLDTCRVLELSLRENGRVPGLWDPLSGETRPAAEWAQVQGRTVLPVRLEPHGSLFIVLGEPAEDTAREEGRQSQHADKNWLETQAVQTLGGAWKVSFDPQMGGPAGPVIFENLFSWSDNSNSDIQYYSGTAVYTKTFNWKTLAGTSREGTQTPPGGKPRAWLELGEVANLAEVELNGISCGIAWTAPYRVEITDVLRHGENKLEIKATNTWANRLIGDQALPETQRITWTTAPASLLEGKPLLKAGLLGPVCICTAPPHRLSVLA